MSGGEDRVRLSLSTENSPCSTRGAAGRSGEKPQKIPRNVVNDVLFSAGWGQNVSGARDSFHVFWLPMRRVCEKLRGEKEERNTFMKAE